MADNVTGDVETEYLTVTVLVIDVALEYTTDHNIGMLDLISGVNEVLIAPEDAVRGPGGGALFVRRERVLEVF
jgi:hypothetical protein